MPAILNTYFKVMAIAFAVVLIWRLLLLLWKTEYAESVLARSPEQRKRLIDSYRRLIRLLKRSLWLVPMAAVAMALGAYFFIPQIDPWVILAAMLELMLLLAAEYYFETWLVRYVTAHVRDPSTAVPTGQK